jgi:type IV secretion system protein VirD4
MDEFLQLGWFPEFKEAIKTHAGSGLRIWYFLQDVGGIEEIYGAGAEAFFNCAVKQFFGVNDHRTADVVGKYLGNTTLAYRSTNSSGNMTANSGNGGPSSGVSISSGETIQFVGRPLLTPDEMWELLSSWRKGGWRWSIVKLSGPRAAKIRLVAMNSSPVVAERLGAFKEDAGDA